MCFPQVGEMRRLERRAAQAGGERVYRKLDLAALAAKLNLPPAIVIQLDISDEVARQRLKQRHHPNDNPELIEERLKNYHREMDMVRSYYPEVNIWTIDGDKPVAEVSSTIEAILKDELPKP